MTYSEYGKLHGYGDEYSSNNEWLKELISLTKECHDDGKTLTFILKTGEKLNILKDDLSEYLRRWEKGS